MSNLQREKRSLDISAAGADTLRAVREAEQNRLAALVSDYPANAMTQEINELHDALIIRTLQLAEQDMARSGHGAPPVPYAYLLFGSAGRGEQTLSSDQDSGLVYGDPTGEAQSAQLQIYFIELATRIVNRLIELGYPPCEGNVIASNPLWCHSIIAWEAQIDGWLAEPTWENVRYLLIVADGRAIYGDASLAERLRTRYAGDRVRTPAILRRLVDNTLRHKVLVGVFGQLLTERYGEFAGSLDVKYGAYIPMVNALRLLAVQAGIHETGTLGRIEGLRRDGFLPPELADQAAEAFETILQLRLLSSFTQEDGQWIGNGKIPAKQLTKPLTEQLKKALKTGKRLQRLVERKWQDRHGGR